MNAAERYGTGYLDARRLEPRWPGPWPAVVNFLCLAVVFYATWWIFQDPRGWLRMYTPYVGYMYCRWLLVTPIWVACVFAFWPFRRRWLLRAHPLVKAVVLVAFTWAILMVLIKGFFQGILGNLAIAYFSPARLERIGISDFYALEYSAIAILMFAAIASWLSPAWVMAMEEAPWHRLSQPVRGLSVWMATFLLSFILYFIAMHPHMGILYHPWQEFTSVTPPWWEAMADTVSGNFSIAWIMCCTVTVWLYESTLGRYPFSLIRHDWARRITAFLGIIAISLCMAAFFHFAQELVWGEAIRGTRRDFAPDWRWLHVGEIAIFLLLPALWLDFYHGNWPQRFATPVNVAVRIAIVAVGGAVLYWLYYKTAHLFLGVQPGFSHPQQFPMIPCIWFIDLMLINYWFMDGWPGWKLVGERGSETARTIAATRTEVRWSRPLAWGLGVGVLGGALLYAAVVGALPTVAGWLTIYGG